MEEDETRKVAVVVQDGQRIEAPEDSGHDAEWDDEAGRSDWTENGAVKTGCGCILPAFMLFALIGAQNSSTSFMGGAEALGHMTATILLGLLFVWAPLFYFWIRGLGKVWMAGSFAIVVAVIAIFGLAKLGKDTGQTREDMTALAEAEVDESGMLVPNDRLANSGPVGQMIYKSLAENQSIVERFQRDIDALQIDGMTQPDRLAREPALAGNCDRFSDLLPKLEEYRIENLGVSGKLIRRVQASELPRSLKREMIAGVESGRKENRDDINKSWKLQAENLRQLKQICVILARKRWQPADGQFAFTHEGDLAAFNRAADETQRIEVELTGLLEASRKRTLAEQEKMLKQLGK